MAAKSPPERSDLWWNLFMVVCGAGVGVFGLWLYFVCNFPRP